MLPRACRRMQMAVVLEFMDGGTLADVLKKVGRLLGLCTVQHNLCPCTSHVVFFIANSNACMHSTVTAHIIQDMLA